MSITELRLTKPCLSPHYLGICCVKHIGLASVLLALVCFVQDKRPFLITPFLLARDFQSVKQLLKGFLEHGLQLAPERKFLGTHFLKAFLTDAPCKVCSVFLRGITFELLALLACLGMSLCHVRIVGGVAVLAIGLMLLALLLAESVHLGIVHLLRHAVNAVPYLVFRHAVEFIERIVQFLLFGEQHTQSVMPHNLMDKRVLHICHVCVVRHNNGYFTRHGVKAAFHPALSCARQCGHFLVRADNAHRCMEPFCQLVHSYRHCIVHGLLGFAHPLAGHLGVDSCNVLIGNEWGVSLASGDNIAVLHILSVECKALFGSEFLAVQLKAVAHLLQLPAHLRNKTVVVAVALQCLTLARVLLPILVNEFGFFLAREHLVYLAPA